MPQPLDEARPAETSRRIKQLEGMVKPLLVRTGIDTITVKLIKPSFDNMLRTLPGGAFDPTDPWYPALHYELRNFYDLTARNIARAVSNVTADRRDLRAATA